MERNTLHYTNAIVVVNGFVSIPYLYNFTAISDIFHLLFSISTDILNMYSYNVGRGLFDWTKGKRLIFCIYLPSKRMYIYVRAPDRSDFSVFMGLHNITYPAENWKENKISATTTSIEGLFLWAHFLFTLSNNITIYSAIVYRLQYKYVVYTQHAAYSSYMTLSHYAPEY